MKQAASSRRRTQNQKRHLRDKAVIDHLVRALYRRSSEAGTTHGPFTLSGLSVEEQVRKAWQPVTVGLAMF